MIRVELSEAEAETLHEVLGHTLSDLRMEIADTDRKEFRDFLKDRKQRLQAVLDMLETGPTT